MGEGISIPFISWFDEPAKKSISSVFSGVNGKVEALDLFNKYKGAHLEMLTETVGKVKVLGMSSPIKLSEFYYPAHVSSDIRRRIYIEQWINSNEKTAPELIPRKSRTVVDASEYVETHDRVVILGGPGAGKTTFLKYIALAYGDKRIFDDTKLKASKLPFFLHLPDLAKFDGDVLSFLSRPLIQREDEYAEEFLRRVFKNGYSAVLFDSLDEVPAQARDAVVEKVRAFCKAYPRNKILISCRTADYKDLLESFNEVELSRLSKVAVTKIVRNWFGVDSHSAARLLSVIKSDAGFSSLTETPLLLSLLCIQFRHDLNLPKRKAEIYRRCVETLLRDWDSSRGFRRSTAYSSLADDYKERLFEHLAGQVLHGVQSYVFKKSEVCAQTAQYIQNLGLSAGDAEDVLREIESHHGIIEQYAMDAYCFSHSSIQDYFTARYAVNSRKDLEFLKLHVNDESRAGIIEFMCAVHPDPSELFEFMMQKARLGNLKNYPAIEKRAKLLFLIYRCIALGPILNPLMLTKVAENLVRSTEGFSSLFAQSGIYPLCVFDGISVTKPYMYSKTRRPSLHDALRPYRSLADEILSKPVDSYMSAAFKRADALLVNSGIGLQDASTILNLVVPLSKSKPSEVRRRVERLSSNTSIDWVKKIADQTLQGIARLPAVV